MKKNILILIFFTAFINGYSFKKITILTDTMAPNTGPYYVQKNLLRGLELINFPFNVNPPTHQVSDVVVVLSGVNNLRNAIQWKASKKISCLLGGPNIMNSPREFDYLFTRKELDACLVPSHWIQVAYEEDAPSLIGRVRCWFAGVDTDYWKPTQIKKNKVLIYWKTEPEDLYQQVENLLRKYGYDPIQVKYGSYNQETYNTLLNQSQFAVFLTRSESQGIALAEAWSMNVPTLNFDPGSLTYQARVYSLVSSCPYLTESTGKTWKTIEDLELLLKDYQTLSRLFKPRDWVLKNMTMQVSALALLNIIETLMGN